MSTFAAKRYDGTYMQVPKIEWNVLLEANFGNPDWEALYPLNKSGAPMGLLPPRLACKLFHDALLVIKKSEENPKFLQDRLPEMSHKAYKKKQWRKQMLECGKRLVCRLANGKGLVPNCIGEDAFIHVILRDLFELGWRRIAQFVEHLPETDKDKDYARIARLAANDDVACLYRGGEEGNKETKASKGGGAAGKSKLSATSLNDCKGWYHAYENDPVHMLDHTVTL